MCACVCARAACMHALVCVLKDNQERLQKKWTILFVYTAELWRLCSGCCFASCPQAFASSPLSLTKAYPFCLVLALTCHDSVRPKGPPSRAGAPFWSQGGKVSWPPLGPLCLDVNWMLSLVHVLKLLRFQTYCGLQPISLSRWTLGICDKSSQRFLEHWGK